ncbi:hypothetical protein B0T18DRAFT_11913 [Schizothecium vesticola]|uniref:Uncharacterized protein n=1 Tax=Schizothecium vesticola TaxID=314040 RepID=A0AA40F920_9PEZI|nr:hypothetical protein B0T18DRAFT_11913 [Schizothecium vesticola]
MPRLDHTRLATGRLTPPRGTIPKEAHHSRPDTTSQPCLALACDFGCRVLGPSSQVLELQMTPPEVRPASSTKLPRKPHAEANAQHNATFHKGTDRIVKQSAAREGFFFLALDLNFVPFWLSRLFFHFPSRRFSSRQEKQPTDGTTSHHGWQGGFGRLVFCSPIASRNPPKLPQIAYYPIPLRTAVSEPRALYVPYVLDVQRNYSAPLPPVIHHHTPVVKFSPRTKQPG